MRLRPVNARFRPFEKARRYMLVVNEKLGRFRTRSNPKRRKHHRADNCRRNEKGALGTTGGAFFASDSSGDVRDLERERRRRRAGAFRRFGLDDGPAVIVIHRASPRCVNGGPAPAIAGAVAVREDRFGGDLHAALRARGDRITFALTGGGGANFTSRLTDGAPRKASSSASAGSWNERRSPL